MIKKIAVLMGGISLEREVSIVSGEGIVEICKTMELETIPIILNGNLTELLPRLNNVDLVFIALHGGDGENGSVQGFLEEMGIKYTGSGVLASALGMDKNISKILAKSIDIPTPNWFYFSTLEESLIYIPKKFPIIVKPNDGGSTIGFTIVKQMSELDGALRYADDNGKGILIEDFIRGRELTVSILAGEVYPIVEIKPSHESYDYECKYTKGLSDYVCPAELPEDLTTHIQNLSIMFYNLLKCKGYARVDFILDESNNPWFLEINTLPGMTETSLVPKSVAAKGVSFKQLIQIIIDEALKT